MSGRVVPWLRYEHTLVSGKEGYERGKLAGMGSVWRDVQDGKRARAGGGEGEGGGAWHYRVVRYIADSLLLRVAE